MKRHQLINHIDALDQTLNQRIENITLLAHDTHSTLKQVPPVWLISIGAAAGALTATIGLQRFYSMGIAGSHLSPLTSKAFSIGKQFGAGE
ncbi:hypothetical protein [Thalassolituus sp.]|jgi:type VI protein secretion system component VasF|uniref:hypothetical protein n=1 Tax=Thalassolituus sp. TaxID=2030822 RepID=UPI002A7FFA1F|nr:hypothetical protein [Thalassolituus sp.]|tara:strand:- start:834 stop:1106 length:273 start_codon:yes stop_codon:yes gene_type:complete